MNALILIGTVAMVFAVSACDSDAPGAPARNPEIVCDESEGARCADPSATTQAQ